MPPQSSLQLYQKHSSTVSLIRGYPSFFVTTINLKDYDENKARKLPLKFHIYNKVEVEHKRLHRNSTVPEHECARLTAEEKVFSKKFEDVNVYISTVHRLPGKDKCEKHISGKTKYFQFGHPDLPDAQKKGCNSQNLKIYVAF